MLTHRLRSQWNQFEGEYDDIYDAQQVLSDCEFTCQYCGRVKKALTGVRHVSGTVNSSTGQSGPDIVASKSHEHIGRTQVCTQCWSVWYLDKISSVRPYGQRPVKLAEPKSEDMECRWYRPINMHTCWSNGRMLAVCDYYRHWFVEVKQTPLNKNAQNMGVWCWSDRMHRRWRNKMMSTSLNSEITRWYLTVS